ncbi:histone-lysine N-methyltransferase, H3 lysine-79 specific-like isoform X1 [Drosophila miranda]|uniref:histone-lysine N-methyltransferase, H3 lysine-79 specific-like isoform X1 n=1 Tax=Drosophila miranda TaxID=7229 RepID=UPI00143F8003|nr:histone-lysine N-methyltransferase, H3 lysine-79 specific-like isoform X1 [Drosophila miranda]
MDDMLDILEPLSRMQLKLEEIRKAHFKELEELFYGVKTKDAKAADNAPAQSETSAVTPQQTQKRPKRLTALTDNTDDSQGELCCGLKETKTHLALSPDAPDVTAESSGRQSARLSNSQLLAIAEVENLNSIASLMPPLPAPTLADTTMSSGRPQRAAKLKTGKLLKEPSLIRKMRRPSEMDSIRVKVESEQRVSQVNGRTHNIAPDPKPSVVEETQPQEPPPTLPIEPIKKPAEVFASKNVCVKVKREKFTGEMPPPLPATDTTSTILETDATRSDETAFSNTTTASEMSKKGRKKKKDGACHRPIKVERFSEIDKNSPVSSRTRKNSTESRNQERSIYKDALEGPPFEEQQQQASAGAAINETNTLSNATMVLGPAPTDESPNIAPADATFEVITSKKGPPKPGSEPRRDSLLTEDESLDDRVPVAKFLSNVKTMKLPGRTHELFNPLLQSPVKMRVEAFENAAIAQSNLRSQRAKDTGTNTSNTPKIGKLQPPTVGRFYTPTQTSSLLPVSSAQPKKGPMSASKATTLLKTATGTNLKSTSSASTKSLLRENSGEDFRKGLHSLAEERKKLREQKHQQAAQQREAKERERTERIAKQTAERAKKQEERKKLEERKRLEVEKLNRKMRQHEEAEALRKAKIRELENQKLAQLTGAKKKILPPPPKTKYTWDMLHEDDSTDDEGKVTHKRPPAPTWSRSHVRGEAIAMQSHCPTDVIDSFFSVAPTTPDLKLIFPNIDPSQLKRNSSVLWSTPPRYSELPKY